MTSSKIPQVTIRCSNPSSPAPGGDRGAPTPAPPLLSLLSRVALTTALLFSLIATASTGLGAQAVDPIVIDNLATDGRHLDGPAETGVAAAINRANAAGVAVAWFDRSGDEGVALTLADGYVEELEELGGPYHTVLVVVANGYAASSMRWTQGELDQALDAAFDGFNDLAIDRGIDAFTGTLIGLDADVTSTPTTGSSSGSGGGMGIGTVLVAILVAGGGFLLVRSFLSRRRANAQAASDLAEDRAEIEEQLRHNADRVIKLGDRVIASRNQELITLYEEASATYQEVSRGIDEATSAEEIDELDDRIDHAEWQFEVIEAELDGRPRPRPPTPADGLPPTPDPPERADRPEPEVRTSPRTGRQYPRTTGTGSGRRRSRRRGGMGGGLGGVLTDIVLGGGLGGGLGGALGGRSRRTRRRTDRGGGFGSGSGGLGGGVLRRGSRSPSRSSRSSRSSGGRSIGARRGRSRGGRRIG